MSTLETLLAQIIEVKQRLDTIRQQSPEMAEALALNDEYHGLFNDLREMCNLPAQIVPMPYPVYPPAHPTWEPYRITWSGSTASTNGTIRIVK